MGKNIILENNLANLEKIWENYPWCLSCLELAAGMAHVQGELKPGLAIHLLTHSLMVSRETPGECVIQVGVPVEERPRGTGSFE